MLLIGIVGKPNSGKSTFLAALTLAPVEISSRPFTTTKPNRAVGYARVPCVCREFEVEDNPVNSICIDGARLIPVELLDCPGLIPGSHAGRGQGNRFLDEVRNADALIHVVDASGSTDAEGRYCKPGYRDPLDDVKFLEEEIALWLQGILTRKWSRVVKSAEVLGKRPEEALAQELAGLKIRISHVSQTLSRLGLDAKRLSAWSSGDLKRFVMEVWKAAKPVIIAANKIDLPEAEENAERIREAGYPTIKCCAEAELTLRKAADLGLIRYQPGDKRFQILASLTAQQNEALEIIRRKVLEKFGTTGIQETLNKLCIDLLNMIVVYPVKDLEKLCDGEGNVLPDAYLVPKGTTARELAYMIHQDLGDRFIHAVDARTGRRLGEDYQLRNNDVVRIVAVGLRA